MFGWMVESRILYSYRKLTGPRKLKQILCHPVEQPGPQHHVLKVAAEVEGLTTGIGRTSDESCMDESCTDGHSIGLQAPNSIR